LGAIYLFKVRPNDSKENCFCFFENMNAIGKIKTAEIDTISFIF